MNKKWKMTEMPERRESKVLGHRKSMKKKKTDKSKQECQERIDSFIHGL
jgi:acetyl-CoA carboxylase carboxyltransferase component